MDKMIEVTSGKAKDKREVVGRFAPTPSGRLHLGNIFSAMVAYLSAKSRGGKCLLRVEDLDKSRCPDSAVTLMKDDLDWFGFRFDGEVLFQNERSAVYEKYFRVLVESGLTYPCYCSRAQLHAATAPHGDSPVYDGRCRNLPPSARPDRPPATRIIAADETIAFTDRLQGEFKQNLAADCGDFIIRRSDGTYAYQLAVVVDDALSGVTEVVRGADLLSSSPRQIYLYRLLGFEPPEFLHVPLVTDGNGERLSKRGGYSNLEYLRSAFSSPERVIGALAFAAGLIDSPSPVARDELIPIFDVTRLKKSDVRLPEELLVR